MQSHPFLSTKRRDAEGPTHFSNEADPYEIDFTQIVHMASFRKLQCKAPSWISFSDRLFSTQLTHSIETAQIGTSLAQLFEFPQRIMSSVGYAHALGTPPLGDEGAVQLREFAQEISGGSITFSPRAQTLRLLGGRQWGQGVHLTAATLDALLLSKQPAEGNCPDGGYYREEGEFFGWIVSQTHTQQKRSPLAMLLEVADAIALSCRQFEDALEMRYLIKEHLLREIHALLLSEPQLSQWCESCFLAPIAALSPYEELQAIKVELKMRLMRAFFSQVSAVRNSPAFYVRLVTLDYPAEVPGSEPINLIYQYCPLLKKALSFLQNMVRSQIARDVRMQAQSYARARAMRNFLHQFTPVLLETRPHHPLIGSLPIRVREHIVNNSHRDRRLRAFLDFVCGLADRECLDLAVCLGGNPLTSHYQTPR